MIYRRKMYKLHQSIVAEFNEHFNQTLLPTQLKYGARLVGRWMTEEKDGEIEIFAIWEYDSREEYERIEARVRNDAPHVERVQGWFKKMGGRENLKKVFHQIDQDFLTSTVS
ncbi:NIPSNAP family protein [Rossellomorea aquimaris]|uniref:NIPSNAP family protein n=1 Tax=Rossellomorea aquimaris TaxID=189382 RepID=UPI001CD58F2F|nr:NIPSNAP family protein [Rossellomorea aquimaris]MCA1054026.1 NIPSNAP family protein [Rossellomorea aquimaris]